MKFENLRKEVKAKISSELKKRLSQIETEEGLKASLSWNGKAYKGNPEAIKAKLAKFLTNKSDKSLNEKLKEIEIVENAPDFKEDFIITVEWRDSRMRGSNPKAYTNTGFVSESIGGCGYDKQSTATAYALNSNNSILKLLFAKKNKMLPKWKAGKDKEGAFNREVLGYGSGYNILPKFEAGVGVECHISILASVGLFMEYVVNTTNTDVWVVRSLK